MRRLAAVGLWLTVAVVGAPREARAERAGRVVIDRIVAVVNRDCVTASELGHRAKPHLDRFRAVEPKLGPRRATLEAKVLRDVLEAIIDEKLVAELAAEKKVAVTDADVEAALEAVARANGLDRAALLEAARQSGLAESDYREELRRQILEGKLLQLLVLPGIADRGALSEEALRARMQHERGALLRRLREKSFIEVRP